MAEKDDIPPNADKILFAEDLVHYIMLINAHVEILPYRVAEYRDFVINRFSETIREAVRIIDDDTKERVEEDILIKMRNNNDVLNRECFDTYATGILYRRLPQGFNASSFLEYSTHLASMAAFFYINGVPEAPGLAVSNIVSAFGDYDMDAGGWDILDRTAEEYASIERDPQNELSPNRQTTDDDAEDMGKNESSNQKGVKESDYDSNKETLKVKLSSEEEDEEQKLKFQEKSCFTAKGSNDSKASNENIPEKECKTSNENIPEKECKASNENIPEKECKSSEESHVSSTAAADPSPEDLKGMSTNRSPSLQNLDTVSSNSDGTSTEPGNSEALPKK